MSFLSYEYLTVNGTSLFTAVLLPAKEGRYPTVIRRDPYVDRFENLPEEDILAEYGQAFGLWLERGYAIIVQHCRGRGKSDGDCLPYINEREDGLALMDWIRRQPFYSGELLLQGTSYLTSVHYAVAPYAPDVKGAIFNVQDCERYNICYRNGFLKKGLHCGWYLGMYKAKSHHPHNRANWDILPFSAFSESVLGEPAEDFDEVLRHPDPRDPFWNTRFGGADARHATDDAHFPILFTTGFYDIYTGGIFEMWRRLNSACRDKSALVISAYDHGDAVNSSPIPLPTANRQEKFGSEYELEWFDYVLGRSSRSPFTTGHITYYTLFKNEWVTDDFASDSTLQFPLGDRAVTYTYDPADAPCFNGGLCCNFGGARFQEKPGQRADIVTVYTPAFEADTLIKGRMTARLSVSSDCEDTCFYMRVSLAKAEGDYGLRDDITSLVFQKGEYRPGETVTLDFTFDEHAFLIRQGERLRVDIASAENANYVRHTNQKGLFSEQTEGKIAHNTVRLQESFLRVPAEKE